jgi:transposase-like protein
MTDFTREPSVKVAIKKRTLSDARLVAEPPSWIARAYRNQDHYADALRRWVREFEDFIRDHRSQDPVHLRVERDEVDVCSCCNADWEPASDENGTFCNHCGATIATP